MVKMKLLSYVVTKIVAKDSFNAKILELEKTNIMIVLNQRIWPTASKIIQIKITIKTIITAERKGIITH